MIPTAGWSCFLSADAGVVAPGPPPASAARLFGARLPIAVAYADLLAGPGVERGLIGPGEAGRLWERHLLNSAVVAELIPSGTDAAETGSAAPGPSVPDSAVPDSAVPSSSVFGHSVTDPSAPDRAGPLCLADLGSGAGLPGIVLAIMFPEVRIVLVEPMARRTAFLAECAEILHLGNVEIRRGRAEELAGQVNADVVTSRAVARLDRLAGLAAGLARPGGLVLAIKGASAQEELRAAEPELRRLGARDAELVLAGTGLVDPPARVVRFVVGTPRGVGRPSAGSGRGARTGGPAAGRFDGRPGRGAGGRPGRGAGGRRSGRPGGRGSRG